MDVWISVCRRKAKCSYCNEEIKCGEPCIFAKSWLKRTQEGGEPKRWVRRLYFHARREDNSQCCWLEQGLESIGKKETVEETRGRKRLSLSKEMRQKRLSLLRKRARIAQRLRALIEVEEGKQVDVEAIIWLGSQLEETKEKIKLVGGVPESWE